MGRAGITLLDVEKAIMQLQGRGKNPTVDAIREVIGTGSKSTIAQHLRDWKSKQPQSTGTLPHDLLALVAGLWERLNLQADQRITENESVSNKQMQELKQCITNLRKDCALLQNQAHHHEENFLAEKKARETLEAELLTQQQNHEKLLERHRAITNQLDERKQENHRLHQLANNIQANLEHYQDACQQLRTEQNLAIEKQQTQFQQEITKLQTELTYHRQQENEYQSQIKLNLTDIQKLQADLQLAQKSNETIRHHYKNTEHELLILKDRYNQQEKKMDTLTNESNAKDTRIQETEKQMAVLLEKNRGLQKSLDLANNKVEMLRDEKMFLIQEKSELQGYLGQIKIKAG